MSMENGARAIKKMRCCKNLGLLFIVVYWISDSWQHHWMSDGNPFELIPDDTHELIMRLLIVLIVLGSSVYIDRIIFKLKKSQHEKLEIYRATIFSSHHIINNLLNSMTFYQDEALNTEGFDKEILDLVARSKEEAETLMYNLGHIENINEYNIKMAVDPNNNKNFYARDNGGTK